MENVEGSPGFSDGLKGCEFESFSHVMVECVACQASSVTSRGIVTWLDVTSELKCDTQSQIIGCWFNHTYSVVSRLSTNVYMSCSFGTLV